MNWKFWKRKPVEEPKLVPDIPMCKHEWIAPRALPGFKECLKCELTMPIEPNDYLGSFRRIN